MAAVMENTSREAKLCHGLLYGLLALQWCDTLCSATFPVIYRILLGSAVPYLKYLLHSTPLRYMFSRQNTRPSTTQTIRPRVNHRPRSSNLVQ